MRYELYSLSGNNFFGINTIGYSDDVNVTHFGPAQRNNYIIHYVLSGYGYFNGQCVKAGQGFLITPQMSEHYYSDRENKWAFIWIIFDNVSNMNELFREYNADPKTNIFEYTNFSAVTQAKKIIINNKNKIYRNSQLYEIFLHIFNSHNSIQKSETSAETMYYNYATNFIDTNLFRKITVDELTKILGISQPYLYNIFKNKVSMSPKQYISMCKIKKAKDLLLETSMPLEEIANSIGIEDSITFSKYFKKTVGVSPSGFRKENNNFDL